MNILDEIVAHKKLEVEKRKAEMPVSQLEQLPLFSTPAYSLKRFLLDGTTSGIIAEFKRRSPSKGTINENANVLRVTSDYTTNGASGLSILTDNKFFGGSIGDVVSARINELPILRKDFIIDEYQIIETKGYGADVLLLIAAILTLEQVKEFTSLAHELGLEVILEIHSKDELAYINDRVDIVGVNNRNLKTFEVNLEQSVYLRNKIPDEKIKISESGIHTAKDIQYLKQSGYNGFLIGETFMQHDDPGLAFMKFISELNEL